MGRFSAGAGAPRTRFGRIAADDDLPPVYLARGEAKRCACLAQAAAVLDVLPGPGESLHALMTGRYDLMHTALAIIGRRGKLDALRIATLSFNAKNLIEMLKLLDDGTTRRLTLLCSAFFRDHNRELWEETREELGEREQRCAAARTHAKVITFAFASGERFVLEGSANLRTNSNIEQFAIFNAPGLHDWHAGWIDAKATTHEHDDDDGEAGGAG